MADNMNVTVRDPLAPRRQMPQIVIGRAGEYGATTVTFDLRGFIDRYGTGTPSLLHKRPPDDEAYIVPPSATDTETHDWVETPDEATLVWHVGQVATSYVGNGTIELQWRLPGTTSKKTAQFDVVVLGAIGNPVSEIPNAQQIYLDVMQGIADDAEDAADRADAAVSHYPEIRDGYWWKWDSELGDWKNTHEPSKGEKGDTGDSVVDATYDSNTGTLTLIPGIPNVRGYVMPEWFGAKGDGTADDTAAIQAAVDSGCNVSFRQGKTYKCGTINVTTNIEIDCRWAEFICTGETLFNCTGKVDSSVAGADYVANAPYTLLNNDKYSGFALLRSTDNVITMREYYYGGFVTLFAEGVCNDCRPVGFTGVTVDKITPIICKISNVGNVTFDAVRDKNTVVKCTYGLNCEFGGFDVDGDYYSTVSIKKSYRCKVSDVNGYLTYAGSLPNYYAIGFDDSSECVAEDCDLTSDFWHCYDVGGNYLCYDNVARNCNFFADSGAVAYNNHANGIGSIIENCVINNVSIGAGGVVRNSKIVENYDSKGGDYKHCRIDMHPTNVQGINTLIVDNVVFDYEDVAETGATYYRGVYVRATAYTQNNHFIVDDIFVSRIYTTHDSALNNYPAVLRLTPNSNVGDFTVSGNIIINDAVGMFYIHPDYYNNIAFSVNSKTIIGNMHKTRADGQGLFRLGTSSDHRFPPIVEIRDSVVWQIDGQFEKLLMFNVSSTHYIVGGRATTLIADNVSRLNTNASLLTNLNNARVTNMRFSDTSLWTYLYISNGSGCYGLLGANGIENRALS